MKYIVACDYRQAIWHARHDYDLPARELWGPEETRWMYISTSNGLSGVNRLLGLEIDEEDVYFVGQWQSGPATTTILDALRTRYRVPTTEAPPRPVRKLSLAYWWVRGRDWAKRCINRLRRGGAGTC